MKKGIALLLVLALSLSLTFAFASEGEIALVTDIGNIDDKSFNQGAWEGVKIYADKAGLSEDDCVYYRPSEDSDAARLEQIETAIDNGAKVIVLPGYLFNSTVLTAQADYPETHFIGVDLDGAATYTENVTNLTYREEISGFCAGYATVKDGYTKLAFLGGIDVPAVVRFGHGFVQGAEAAAVELDKDIEMKYWYSGAFWPTDEIKGKTSAWYSEGTEVVFSSGGGVYLSALASAEEADGKLIGVDVDQSYISPRFITSAYKDLRGTVATALEAYYANGEKFPADYAGKTVSLSADSKAVGIPTNAESWRFQNYTVEEFETMYAKLISGEITVDPALDAHPATTRVTVDYQN